MLDSSSVPLVFGMLLGEGGLNNYRHYGPMLLVWLYEQLAHASNEPQYNIGKFVSMSWCLE